MLGLEKEEGQLWDPLLMVMLPNHNTNTHLLLSRLLPVVRSVF